MLARPMAILICCGDVSGDVRLLSEYRMFTNDVVADWLQSVHVVSTAGRVVGRVTVYTAPARVTQFQDDVIVSKDIMASTVTDVSSPAHYYSH